MVRTRPARGRDAEREDRIAMEIVVDAYNAGERAMGWYCYLDEKLRVPLKVRCFIARPISPLAVGDQTSIVRLASEDECHHEMFVEVPWGKRTLAVPLAQLEPLVGADAESIEAI